LGSAKSLAVILVLTTEIDEIAEQGPPGLLKREGRSLWSDEFMGEQIMGETKAAEQKLGTADIIRVMKLLPHRYPMLLVDRMYDMKGDESCVGVKNVTINEPFFQGHFPQFPVMPGVLIIEGLAQTAGALCVSSLQEDYKAELVYFMGIDNAKFRKPVLPGDQLHYHVKKIRNRGRVWRFFGEAKVNGQTVAEAEISAMLADTADAKAFASKHG
jgi:3-hydroxyacyl-[acyl-carrier-protein] dehydratase